MVRADLSLSNHIIIERKGNSGYDVYARCLGHPGVQESITEQFRDSCSCTFSFGVEYDGGQDESICLACNRLLDIPIIDVVGYNPITADPSMPPFDMIPGNATLRWPNFAQETEALWSLGSGSDQVFWLQHDGIENVDITFDLDEEALHNAPDAIGLVFNFECSVSPTSGTALTQFHIPAWQELEGKGCLTFIFHDMRINAKKPPPPNPAFMVGLLQCYTATGISVTIVGLESFIKTSRGWEKYEETVFSGFLNYRTEVMESDNTEDY